MKINDETINEMVQTIVAEVDPEQVILYGSRARGQHREDSDVDLLIVEREPFGKHRSRHAELKRIRRALLKYPVAKDLLLYSQDEFAKWQHSVNHIVNRCRREGKTLYERC